MPRGGTPFTPETARLANAISHAKRKARLEKEARRITDPLPGVDKELRLSRIDRQLEVLHRVFIQECGRVSPDAAKLERLASCECQLLGLLSEAPGRRPSKAVPMHQIETFVDQAEQQLNSLDTQPLADQNNTSGLTTQPIIPLTNPPPNNTLADDSSNKSILSPNQTVPAPHTGTPQTVGT